MKLTKEMNKIRSLYSLSETGLFMESYCYLSMLLCTITISVLCNEYMEVKCLIFDDSVCNDDIRHYWLIKRIQDRLNQSFLYGNKTGNLTARWKFEGKSSVWPFDVVGRLEEERMVCKEQNTFCVADWDLLNYFEQTSFQIFYGRKHTILSSGNYDSIWYRSSSRSL